MASNKVHFGFRSVYYSIITETISGGVVSTTYGTPKPWAGAVGMTLTPKGSANNFRADNTNYYQWGSNSGYEGSFESAGIPTAVYEDVFGRQRDDDDLLVESTSDVAKEVALLFEIDGDGGTPERYCFFKCSISNPPIEAETTSEDGNEPKTVTVDLSVAPRADGLVQVMADDSTDDTAYAGFFSAVPEPTFTPPTP